MLFNKNKNKIQELERDLSFWQKTCDEFQNTINELREENKLLKITNDKLNTQIVNMEQLSQENEIMRKYYKADEEPSSEVQAKILADLRLHDMEYQRFKEKIDEIKTLQYHNSFLSLANAAHYLPYHY